MRLSQMQDVGGCRAVVSRLDVIYEIVADLERQGRWAIDHVDDYASSPQDTGYRAVHLIVRKNDRFIEVQLRTREQHTWAEIIEGADRSRVHGTEVDLKHGEGPSEVVGYYREIAEILSIGAAGEDISDERIQRLLQLQTRIFSIGEEEAAP